MKNRKWLKILLVLLAIVIMGVVFSCQANPEETVSDGEVLTESGVLTDDTSEEVFATDAAGQTKTQLPAGEPAEGDASDPTKRDPSQKAEGNQSDPDAAETELSLCVHVCGCVKTPGVYYLPEGARVHEAVTAAGGLTKDAADDRINLAEAIYDGEQICIPSIDDPVETGAVSKTGSAEAADDGKVNINTASAEELSTLPGIGAAKAKAIISYRETAGNFSTIEDIVKVSGIGKNSFEKIKDYIKV